MKEVLLQSTKFSVLVCMYIFKWEFTCTFCVLRSINCEIKDKPVVTCQDVCVKY